jgi:hypothetical protein
MCGDELWTVGMLGSLLSDMLTDHYCKRIAFLLGWERSRALMIETPVDIAACKDEIREALDANVAAIEWGRRRTKNLSDN